MQNENEIVKTEAEIATELEKAVAKTHHLFTKEKVAILCVYCFIVISSILRAFSIHVFVLPNEFAPGGVTGISAMLQFATGWSSGVFLLMLNLPLIIMSGFFLGKRFAIRTLVSAATTSSVLMLLQFLKGRGVVMYEYNTQNTILASLAGGLLSGFSLAILLKCGSSTGGLDIIATLIHKKRPNVNIGYYILSLDAVVVITSIFVYKKGLDPVFLAFIMIFISSQLCNSILSGFKSAHKFEIITKEPEIVSAVIIKRLNHTVTMLPAIGMYQHEQRSLLVCIVRKSEIAEMQRIIREFPDTFCYVSNTTEVYGLGFSSRH